MNHLLSRITTLQMWVTIGVSALVALAISLALLLPLTANTLDSHRNYAQLSELLENETHPAEQLKQIERQVVELDKKLNGELAELPTKQIESFVIGELQSISWQQDINLIGIVPSQGQDISIFSEHLFQVRLTGNFFEIANWLSSVRNQLGFIVVKQFVMQPIRQANSGWNLQVELIMSSYRYRSRA